MTSTKDAVQSVLYDGIDKMSITRDMPPHYYAQVTKLEDNRGRLERFWEGGKEEIMVQVKKQPEDLDTSDANGPDELKQVTSQIEEETETIAEQQFDLSSEDTIGDVRNWVHSQTP